VRGKNGISGGEGGLSWEPILENPEGGGVVGKIPWEGMDIFWNYTMNVKGTFLIMY